MTDAILPKIQKDHLNALVRFFINISEDGLNRYIQDNSISADNLWEYFDEVVLSSDYHEKQLDDLKGYRGILNGHHLDKLISEYGLRKEDNRGGMLTSYMDESLLKCVINFDHSDVFYEKANPNFGNPKLPYYYATSRGDQSMLFVAGGPLSNENVTAYRYSFNVESLTCKDTVFLQSIVYIYPDLSLENLKELIKSMAATQLIEHLPKKEGANFVNDTLQSLSRWLSPVEMTEFMDGILRNTKLTRIDESYYYGALQFHRLFQQTNMLHVFEHYPDVNAIHYTLDPVNQYHQVFATNSSGELLSVSKSGFVIEGLASLNAKDNKRTPRPKININMAVENYANMTGISSGTVKRQDLIPEYRPFTSQNSKGSINE